MKFKGILNLADVHQKRKLMVAIGALTSPHMIEMKPYKPRRSNRANAFYWAAVVTAFVQYNEEQGVQMEPEQAHDILAKECLGKQNVVNHRTGEIIDTIRKPTHDLNTEEFSAYVERSIAWLGDLGIEIPSQELV